MSQISLRELMSWNKLTQIFTFSHQLFSVFIWLLVGELKASETDQVDKGLAVNWAWENYSGPYILVIFSEAEKATDKPSSVLDFT